MNDFIATTEVRFLIALFLGLLVGLEREAAMADRHRRMFGGVRTYALISLFGFACGWLAKEGASWMLPAGLASITALALLAYFTKTKFETYGTTSEVAALLTFLVGVLAMLADAWLPAALGIVTALLLSEKSQLEGLVEKLDRTEFLAIVKFLIVTVIILPILPDRSYTRFFINPYHVWRIVVLVSAVGFVGYFLTRQFGEKIGLRLSGLLGGIVSSTAVSVAMGRIARTRPEEGSGALQSAILACSVMYVRILVLLFFIQPAIGAGLWWRMLALAAAGILISFTVRPPKGESAPASTAPPAERMGNLRNPFEVRPAALFAMLFVLLSILSEYAKQQFGDSGLFGLSIVAGAIDVDPYILSISRGAGFSQLSQAITAIVIAAMSNTIFKGMYFSIQAGRGAGPIMLRFGVWALLHLPFCF